MVRRTSAKHFFQMPISPLVFLWYPCATLFSLLIWFLWRPPALLGLRSILIVFFCFLTLCWKSPISRSFSSRDIFFLSDRFIPSIHFFLPPLYAFLHLFLKGCEAALKEASRAAARETLPIVATKLESTAQCETVPIPPITGPPKMSKSWLIRMAAQYIGKLKRDSGRKKGAHELGQLPTSLAAFMDQFREEKAYRHLKLNLAKSYYQEAFPNSTHSVMAT